MSQARRVFQLGAILVLCGRAAPATDHPQDALHLILKQSVTSGRARAKWVSRVPAVTPPAADPRSVGATLRIIGLHQDVTIPLPAGRWSRSAGGGYRFMNAEAPAGPSPVKRALITPGWTLAVSAATSGIDLGDPRQGTVSVALVVGGDCYCSTCTTPSRDEAGRYLAAACEAPAACPPPAAPLTPTADGFRSDLVTNPAAVFVEPQTPKPAYLVTASPLPFGTPITRIANDPRVRTFPVTGTWGTDARHVYSTQQPWNADETLITIENRGTSAFPSPLVLDGGTYQPKSGPCTNYPLWDYRWHPGLAHSHEQINVTADGLELMWFDVVSCTKTRSWALPIAANYGIGSGKGNPSNDGRFVLIAGTTRIYVVDMDPQPTLGPYPNQRIGPPLDVSGCGLADCTIAWAGISASGRYGIVSYTGDNIRVFDVDPATLALSPHAMPASSYRCAGTPAAGYIYSLGHADVALNPFDNDEDVLVGQDECHLSGQTVNGVVVSHVMMARLRDGQITALTDPSNEAYPDHISMRNLNRPGWAYVDFYQQDGMRFSDEVIAVKLDGSRAVQRFAHKHSVFAGCYRCESHPAPSMDGRRILFASNWAEHCGASCGSNAEIEDYLIDARGPRSSP